MNRLIYIGLIVMVLVISGCATSSGPISQTDDGTIVYYSDTNDYDRMQITDYGKVVKIELEDYEEVSLDMWVLCEDKVVCYEADGMSCLRHKDLVEKYCTIIEDARWKTKLKDVGIELTENRVLIDVRVLIDEVS